MTSTLTPVRVRFAPSPTGYLHVGGARTALFNWLLARRTGGTLVLRIEDTDRLRHVDDSVRKIVDDLRWLGLDWDEGPEVGGDHGPYFQSLRFESYGRYLRQLLEAGRAYYALESPDELRAMREEAEQTTGGFRYPRPDPVPTVAEGEAARESGRQVVVRFKMPDAALTVQDEILGSVTVPSEKTEDFVIQKSDGFPTYHFACVVDDALMKITHVLRGQEHLMNTPKHVALQRALGFGTPAYAHLPVIFNTDGSKMSKRDKEKTLKKGMPPPEIEVHDFRTSGYLPEAIVNFIALLGWSPGDDRELFDRHELAEHFSVERVGKSNARFDRGKLVSFNRDWASRLPSSRLLQAFKDYLSFSSTPMRLANDATLGRILDACAGFRTFHDVIRKAGFLFESDDAIQYDPKAVKKVLAKNNDAGYSMLERLKVGLQALDQWTPEGIEQHIARLCEETQSGLGLVAQPLRVAVSGTAVSPSIHETLSLLGKVHTIARINRCLRLREAH